MDLNLIYAKTPAGEQAVQERTRLVQRNHRNVLIMVDGRNSVQDLCEKVGKAKIVESALEQLEKDGYIRQVARSALRESGDQGVDEAQDDVTGTIADRKLVAAAPPMTSPAVGPSPFAIPVSSPSPFAVPPSSAHAPTAPDSTGAGGLKGMLKVGKDRAEEHAAAAEEPIDIKPIRRGPRTGIGLYGGLAISILAISALLVATVFAFPYGIYQADIEAALGKVFGQTVKVGAVRGSLSPLPVIILDRVQIGDAGEATVNEVVAVPSAGSLFGGPRHFRKVEIVGARIPAERLSAIIPAVLQLAQTESFSVQHLAVSGLAIGFRDLSINDLSGQVLPAADGKGASLQLQSKDGNVRADLGAGEGGATVVIEITGWKPVDGAKFVWDTMSVQGVVSGSTFVASKVSGRLLDGAVLGQARFDWKDVFDLRADLAVERASARRVSDSFGSAVALDGDLNAKIRMSGNSTSLAGLWQSTVADVDFLLTRGVVNGIDLVEAVRRGGKASSQGGMTRFEQLSGRAQWDSKQLRLSGLEGASGALHASGVASISGNQQLAGSFDVRLKGTATEIRMPVALGGTLKDPQLQGGRR